MWKRRAWAAALVSLLVVGATAPSFTGQGAPREKGERKEREKEKGKVEKSEPEKEGPSIRVTLSGTLTTGVTYGGTETTGTEMTVDDVRGVTFELDLSRAKELAETARKLNGRPAVAKGALEVRQGRLRKLRFILHTTELKGGPKATAP